VSVEVRHGSGGAGDGARIVAATSGRGLAKRLAAELAAPLEHLVTEQFANENLLCRTDGLDVAGREVLFVATSRSPVSEALLELLFGLDALRVIGPRRLTAVVPYLPYARSDRPAWPGAPVPVRQMADWIERAGADRVVSFDLHAPQMAGFFRIPVLDLGADGVLGSAVRRWGLERLTIASPDLGGAKRASRFAEFLGAPLVIMRKRREKERTVTIDLLGDVAGRTLLLVDDEIATGATILSAATAARRAGARAVVAAATHGVFAGDALARLESSPVERIAVTDSLPGPGEASSAKLEVVSIIEPLARALRP
jgi:ribose-phosphate pyrophosphokinase